MRIWAHRGCSLRYPENTLSAFRAAAEIPGLAGIETDVQMAKDGELIVLHDEKVDRTTNGTGWVKDFTLSEIQALSVDVKDGGAPEHIPTLEEVLDVLAPYMKNGLKLNIELKNSKVQYPGMEARAIATVGSYGVLRQTVWSSFYAKSLSIVRSFLPDAEIGILDIKASDCLYKMKGGCGADVIHPYAKAMDVTAAEVSGLTVRGWLTEKLYPAEKTEEALDLEALEKSGVTDVFMNEPERFL
ncbi:MAG: glycerophosphodiester phosphodiesterase family protein [Eubacteriales bacterium]|nr:glycerophosphodiester phosphodiesterase family protein [Eubacteriales bacterium]